MACTPGDSKPILSSSHELCRIRRTICLLLGDTLGAIQRTHDYLDALVMLAEHFDGRPHGLKILGQPPGMVASRPDLFEDVLKTQFETFDKGPFFQEIMHDLLGDGIFGADGAKWVHQHKTASHLFSMNALREAMRRTMHCRIPIVHGIFQRAATAKQPLGLIKLFHQVTIDVFAELCFGIELGELDATEDHAFAIAVDGAQRIPFLRTLRPSWYWKALRWLNIGREHELKQHLRVINATVYDIISKALDIRAHQDQPPANGSQNKAPQTLISMFMDAMSRDDPETELDPVYLRDIMVNFLIAGRDTTAQALSWCVYALTQHPTVEQKLRQELKAMLPELWTGQIVTPTMAQANALVYLDAVVKETLRLYPSVPANVKHANRDTVPCDGTFVQTGTCVTVSAYVLGRSEACGALTPSSSSLSAGSTRRLGRSRRSLRSCSTPSVAALASVSAWVWPPARSSLCWLVRSVASNWSWRQRSSKSRTFLR